MKINTSKRKFPREKSNVIWTQVNTLKDTKIVIEVDNLIWLSNVVLVNKVCGASQIYIAFTNVNDSCPKDYFPLSNIDKIVNICHYKTRSYEFPWCLIKLSPNHIDPEDEAKTYFITKEGTLRYARMSFRLKNAWAIYQRLVNRMFKDLLRWNMEVYVDEMIVKSYIMLIMLMILRRLLRWYEVME